MRISERAMKPQFTGLTTEEGNRVKNKTKKQSKLKQNK
jgi:hypothetical protein